MKFQYTEEPPPMLSPLSSPAPRAVEMEQLYPGVQFLPQQPSKMEIRIANKFGMPTLTYPLAILEYETLQPVSGLTTELLKAFERCWIPEIGEVSFTTLKYATGLSFEEVMGGCLDAYINHDHWVFTRLYLHRWEEGKFYYTVVGKLVRRGEEKDPKWLREVYRG